MVLTLWQFKWKEKKSKMTKRTLVAVLMTKKLRQNLDPIWTLRMNMKYMKYMKVSHSCSMKMPYVLIKTKQTFPNAGYYGTVSPCLMRSPLENCCTMYVMHYE